tara:strand:- start:2960 stop:4000 length:1041 start_codon:yes stop_codon:yes gene_type:complete
MSPGNNNLYGVNEINDTFPISVRKGNEIESMIIGSSIHKDIRKFIRPHLKPGLKLSELANLIENKCIELTNNNGINSGIGFPSSLSVNDCAAHFTPSSKYDVTLNKDSILKIDFGVEVNGWITDSAFTIAFNEKYKDLLDAVKEATYTGIKNAAYDVNIKEWGKDIQEVMESYECTIDGKTSPIKVLKNLGGHNILQNKIHGGIFLPAANINYYPDNLRFGKGVYAVETFGSTKSDWVIEKSNENTIYMNKQQNGLGFNPLLISDPSKKMYNNLLKNFSTIPYCDRYLDKIYDANYHNNIKELASSNIIGEYPPLHCSKGGMTAQYEHSVYLDDGKKLVLSQSSDY